MTQRTIHDKVKEGRPVLKQILTEEHHRRSRSLGGSDSLSNISYVPRGLHRDWHTLHGNLNAKQISQKFNASPRKPKGVTVICRFINGDEVTMKGRHDSKNVKKCQLAWERLFGNMTFSEAINYTNSVWLDASYHLYIVKE
jgi:hypothetical protein